MEKPKFRASYSVLSAWARGDWEAAVRMYFGLPRVVTPQMADGRYHHAAWEEYIHRFRRLPDIFGGKALQDPQTELKQVAQIYDWLELVGTVDCYDSPTIYEFKTGTRSSARYLASYQVEVYGVLATLSGMYAERAEIHHFDQYTREADMSLVWLTEKALRRGLNWIETLSAEMYQYLLNNRLYERFRPADNPDTLPEADDTSIAIEELKAAAAG